MTRYRSAEGVGLTGALSAAAPSLAGASSQARMRQCGQAGPHAQPSKRTSTLATPPGFTVTVRFSTRPLFFKVSVYSPATTSTSW